MMILKTLLSAGALLWLLQPGMAQTTIVSNGADLYTFANSDHDYLKSRDERYSTVGGSPYLDDEFQEGSLYFNKTRYTGVSLRYNAYEGYFEFETEEGIKYFDPQVTKIDTVWLDGDVFRYVYFQHGRTGKQTYMKVLHNGAASAYWYDEVIMTEPEESTGYAPAKPASFQKLAGAVYIQVEGKPALELKGKKSLDEVFPDHLAELNSYVKTEKLKLKNTEDVVRLCQYYESLL
jgi:hypothetical protein